METGRTSEGGKSPDLGASVSAKTASCVEFLLRFFYLIQGGDATRNACLYRRISLFHSTGYSPSASSENGRFSGKGRHRISSRLAPSFKDWIPAIGVRKHAVLSDGYARE